MDFGVEVIPVPGRPGDYALRVPIPADVLNEGVQTFLIRAADQTLAHFTIVTGVAMEDDLRAEIDQPVIGIMRDVVEGDVDGHGWAPGK